MPCRRSNFQNVASISESHTRDRIRRGVTKLLQVIGDTPAALENFSSHQTHVMYGDIRGNQVLDFSHHYEPYSTSCSCNVGCERETREGQGQRARES